MLIGSFYLGRRGMLWISLLLTLALVASALAMTSSGAGATPDVLVIEDLTGAVTATDLANQLVGTGITVTTRWMG